jgi:uncharacterized damage-inducible protein DinB
VKLTELFIADMERERGRTRKAIEAVPEGNADWKPHERAMPLGRLTNLVATMPSWITMMIGHDEFDVVPQPGQQSQFSRQLTTRADLARAIDEGFDGARQALGAADDHHLMKPWRLKAGGKVVAEAPRHEMMRDALMHLAHHRGQLTTYLRVLGATVPAIYGPSADEQSF